MRPDGRIETRVEQVGQMSRGLKILARELQVPVIALSQLSARRRVAHDKRPLLCDLRESGQIEQDADLVMFIYRDEYYNENTDRPGEADLIIAKHRNGGLGDVPLIFQGEYPRFLTASGDEHLMDRCPLGDLRRLGLRRRRGDAHGRARAAAAPSWSAAARRARSARSSRGATPRSASTATRWRRCPTRCVRPIRALIRELDDNLDAGRGLWLFGDVGTGKTTLAMLVAKAALEAGRSVAIYSLPRLLNEIRRTYDEGSDSSYVELLDRLAEVDLLHVDDLGAEKSSPWVLEQLYAIVNARYEGERSMVITTNLDREALVEQITERTVSRLEEMCEAIPLHGDRPPARSSGAGA